MTTTQRTLLIAATAGMGILLAASVTLRAHCQIPCGIYDDPVRFTLLAEHIQTMEKSMRMIEQLSEEPDKNANQLVRWVNNKEHHAELFSQIITEYFLAQRIAPGKTTDRDYVEKVVLCHRLLVTAMKVTQTTDEDHIKQLRQDLHALEKAYFKDNEQTHNHGHDHDHDHD